MQYTKHLILALLLVTLFGCATPIKPPVTGAKLVNTELISSQEQEKLLYYSLEKEYKSRPFVVQNPFVRNSSHYRRFWTSAKWTNDRLIYQGSLSKYQHKFVVRDGAIARIDLSRKDDGRSRDAEEAYCTFCDDYGFNNYVTYFLDRATHRFQADIDSYISFKKRYDKAPIEVVNANRAIPESLISKLTRKIEKKKNRTPAVDVFTGRKSFNSFQERSLGKYQFQYKQSSDPSSPIYRVTDVSFNFVPEKFILEDENVAASIKNGLVLNIRNTSTSFVDVTEMAGYYDGRVYRDLLSYHKKEGRITIPPMSEVELMLVHLRDKQIPVESKNQSVEYGYSIAYKSADLDGVKSIYKTDKYRVSDL